MIPADITARAKRAGLVIDDRGEQVTVWDGKGRRAWLWQPGGTGWWLAVGGDEGIPVADRDAGLLRVLAAHEVTTR